MPSFLESLPRSLEPHVIDPNENISVDLEGASDFDPHESQKPTFVPGKNHIPGERFPHSVKAPGGKAIFILAKGPEANQFKNHSSEEPSDTSSQSAA